MTVLKFYKEIMPQNKTIMEFLIGQISFTSKINLLSHEEIIECLNKYSATSLKDLHKDKDLLSACIKNEILEIIDAKYPGYINFLNHNHTYLKKTVSIIESKKIPVYLGYLFCPEINWKKAPLSYFEYNISKPCAFSVYFNLEDHLGDFTIKSTNIDIYSEEDNREIIKTVRFKQKSKSGLFSYYFEDFYSEDFIIPFCKFWETNKSEFQEFIQVNHESSVIWENLFSPFHGEDSIEGKKFTMLKLIPLMYFSAKYNVRNYHFVELILKGLTNYTMIESDLEFFRHLNLSLSTKDAGELIHTIYAQRFHMLITDLKNLISLFWKYDKAFDDGLLFINKELDKDSPLRNWHKKIYYSPESLSYLPKHVIDIFQKEGIQTLIDEFFRFYYQIESPPEEI